MELTFNKTGELYVAEFKADKEFSLHIERMNGLGSIKMQQNGAEGGKYADVEDFEASNSTKPVIEYDSGAFVAPKWIRIESSVLPTYAAITTEGDVVEIKSQVKSIEITSNGTTSVEPDAGFGYLSGVNVSVNVPQSGGGDASGESDMVYLDWAAMKSVTPENLITQVLIMFGMLATDTKVKILNSYGIAPAASTFASALYNYTDNALDTISNTLVALSINLNQRMTSNGKLITISESLGEEGLASINAFKISESEFYNLES